MRWRGGRRIRTARAPRATTNALRDRRARPDKRPRAPRADPCRTLPPSAARGRGAPGRDRARTRRATARGRRWSSVPAARAARSDGLLPALARGRRGGPDGARVPEWEQGWSDGDGRRSSAATASASRSGSASGRKRTTRWAAPPAPGRLKSASGARRHSFIRFASWSSFNSAAPARTRACCRHSAAISRTSSVSKRKASNIEPTRSPSCRTTCTTARSRRRTSSSCAAAISSSRPSKRSCAMSSSVSAARQLRMATMVVASIGQAPAASPSCAGSRSPKRRAFASHSALTASCGWLSSRRRCGGGDYGVFVIVGCLTDLL